MEFKVEQVGSVVVITAPAVQLHSIAPMARRLTEFREVLSENESRDIVFDMSQMEFIESSFISALVDAQMNIGRRNCVFALCGLTHFVHGVICKANLDRLLTIHATREEALAAAGAA